MGQDIQEIVRGVIESSLQDLGYGVVQVSLQGTQSDNLVILLERLDGVGLSVSDCRIASHTISALLDVEDLIKDKYYLEVSSAGVERPLVKFEDYTRFLGQEAKIRLKEPLNGCGHYQGKIIETKDGLVHIKLVDGNTLTIPFAIIKNARLVFTEEMFRKMLNKK